MCGLMKVLGGVPVLGRIAAADMAALEAQTQVNPGIMHLETFFAALAAGSDFSDLFQVRTGLGHNSPQDFLLAFSASRTTASVANAESETGNDQTAIAEAGVLHATQFLRRIQGFRRGPDC
jgi:hypothetical protein